MTRVAIVAGVRTPIAKKDKAYRDVHPVDLLATSFSGALAAAGIDPANVDMGLAGATGQVGGQAQNIGRNAWLSSGLPMTVPIATLDAQCPSSQLATNLGVASIMAGDASVVITGGVESLTRVPTGIAGTLGEDGPISQSLRAHWDMPHQGEAAERAADKYGITREACDEYGVRSHLAAHAAWERGAFDNETVHITVGGTVLLNRDEGIRPDSSIEKAGKLPSVYRPDGVNNAANSSQLSDGSAAMILASEEACARLGLSPLAWIRSTTFVGNDPDIIFDGPNDATAKILHRTGLTLDDMRLIDVHEAYAVPVLIWQEHFGVSLDRVNLDGGAISIGHPFGATGARQLLHLAHALRAAGGGIGLSTMCGGGGIATATVIESI
ncbi:thiolase family protein [Streptomyces phaeochromogenes]|uniref:thiolase family protein n=1 Tax=Streptomyces phaeochromogenes TaxID=1923 RepID=UPI0038643D3B|nr:thiolase family protein [Streptomyces phaeochromogenes]